MDVTLLDSISDPVPTRPKDFGVTVPEYAKAKGCTTTISRKVLAKAVEDGVLIVLAMRDGAGTCPNVYCRPGDWPQK
jgi:hypothetical protein